MISFENFPLLKSKQRDKSDIWKSGTWIIKNPFKFSFPQIYQNKSRDLTVQRFSLESVLIDFMAVFWMKPVDFKETWKTSFDTFTKWIIVEALFSVEILIQNWPKVWQCKILHTLFETNKIFNSMIFRIFRIFWIIREISINNLWFVIILFESWKYFVKTLDASYTSFPFHKLFEKFVKSQLTFNWWFAPSVFTNFFLSWEWVDNSENWNVEMLTYFKKNFIL